MTLKNVEGNAEAVGIKENSQHTHAHREKESPATTLKWQLLCIIREEISKLVTVHVIRNKQRERGREIGRARADLVSSPVCKKSDRR